MEPRKSEREVFAIVFRWVTSDLQIIQRLVDVGKCTYSFQSDEFAAAVSTILRRYFMYAGARLPNKINDHVITFQSDRVSVNTAG